MWTPVAERRARVSFTGLYRRGHHAPLTTLPGLILRGRRSMLIRALVSRGEGVLVQPKRIVTARGWNMRFFRINAALLLLAFGLLAQSDRGTITGTIADPAGAVVASGKVEAKNIATGAVYEVASTDTGNYTIAQLPAGTYEMTVTVPGFKKFVRQNLTVQVAATVRIDVVLEVGATSESVTVTEAAPLLKTESG